MFFFFMMTVLNYNNDANVNVDEDVDDNLSRKPGKPRTVLKQAGDDFKFYPPSGCLFLFLPLSLSPCCPSWRKTAPSATNRTPARK